MRNYDDDVEGNLKHRVAKQNAMNRSKFRFIAVRPALPPEVVAIDREEIEQAATDIVGTPWEFIRYPAHLDLPLTVLANGNGLSCRLAYNRWGLVGGFVVTRYSSNGNRLSLTDKQIQRVLCDLNSADDGYLNPSCNANNALRESFAIHGCPPSGWVPPARK